MRKRYVVLTVYIVFLMLPIYWLLNMSFKTTNEILGGFSAFPRDFTLDSYRTIFTDPSWYNAYINSITYVVINTVISVTLALPKGMILPEKLQVYVMLDVFPVASQSLP